MLSLLLASFPLTFTLEIELINLYVNSTQGELSLVFKVRIDCSVDERWQTRSLNSR